MIKNCPNCGWENLALRTNAKNPKAIDLFCPNCGKWLKFANKEEQRVFMFDNSELFKDITSALKENRLVILPIPLGSTVYYSGIARIEETKFELSMVSELGSRYFTRKEDAEKKRIDLLKGLNIM